VMVTVTVTAGATGWPVMVGVVEVGVVDTRHIVSQPGADAERYRCACLHCTQMLAGRGDGYQCGLDWGRSCMLKYLIVSTDMLCVAFDRQ